MMSELRAGAPITAAGITLIPIERMRVNYEKQSFAYWLNATKEVVAVVICEREGPRLLNIEAEERGIDELIFEVPELGSMLLEFLSP